jgi:putative membrane protein
MNKNTVKKTKRSLSYWIGRTLIIWIGGVLGLMLISSLSVGLEVSNWETAFEVVVLLGVLNALFWPLLSRVFLPFMVYTVGVGSLLLNGILIWVISEFVPGITIQGWALILAPIGMTLVTTILSYILTADDDATYYRIVVRNRINESKGKEHKKNPGVIFLEIDGLAEKILKEALDKGHMPTLKSWLKEGTHKITGWETDLSSQTGASQAGILHGNNHNIPAFRWVEKPNNNKVMVSTGLNDAPVIEERISDGKGLLYLNGASRSNLFSGDAGDVIFTYSKLKDLKRFYTKSWYYFYSSPSSFSRIIVLFFGEVISDFISQVNHSLRNIKPRIRRGLVYPFVRAGAAIFLREITTYTLIGDIINGDVDVGYVTYLGYDEIAHHSGVRDGDAFHALRGLDKQFKRLEEAKEYAERPYHLVIQSDHGQTNGATFKQRYGITLEDLVRDLMPPDINIYSKLSSNEDHFGQAITVPGEDVKRYLTDKKDTVIEDTRKVKDSTLKTFNKKYEAKEIPKKFSKEEADAIVLASGNLGLIYLTQWKDRLTYEEMNHLYPDLIPGVAQHPGVGFIMVKSSENGPLALNDKGRYHLADHTVEGENPLANFGPRAAEHLLRTDGFEYAPDILAMSLYDPENDEVAAFEELVGSHGGLGGTQSQPFIMHPVEWELGGEEIIGAEKLHQVLKDQIKRL